MLPQDQRSPFEQQRWVDAINVDSVDIPPYACCEVTNNTVTNDITVLSVRRPTKDGLPQVVLNGLKPIPANGGTGFVTGDYPAFAIATGNVGDAQGSQANSFQLKAGVPGFVLIGAGPPGGGLMRVLYHHPGFTILRGLLTYPMCTTDATGTVNTVKNLQSCVVVDVTAIKNPLGLAGLTGDIVILVWSCVDMAWIALQVQHHQATVMQSISYDPNCAIDQTTYQLAAMFCATAAASVAIELYSQNVIIDLQLNNPGGGTNGDPESCAIQANVQAICIFDDLDLVPENWVNKVNFFVESLLNNVYQSGLTIRGTYIDVFVPCAGDLYSLKLLDLEQCSSGSGSGSSGGS